MPTVDIGSFAFGAYHLEDAKLNRLRGQFYGPPVVSKDCQKGITRTGIGHQIKLNFISNRIIKGLRNLIAISDKNDYHSIVHRL